MRDQACRTQDTELDDAQEIDLGICLAHLQDLFQAPLNPGEFVDLVQKQEELQNL